MWLVVLWAASGLPVVAADPPIDSELMQALEDHQKELASQLGVGDASAAQASTAEMLRLLQEVRAWYAARPALAEGVALSDKALAHAGRVREHLGQGRLDAAAAAATDLGRSCKSCHEVFKKDA